MRLYGQQSAAVLVVEQITAVVRICFAEPRNMFQAGDERPNIVPCMMIIVGIVAVTVQYPGLHNDYVVYNPVHVYSCMVIIHGAVVMILQ